MGRSPREGAVLERKLLKVVGSQLEEVGLVRGRGSLVVAVSGGPDSLALLLLLARLRESLGLTLHVAHLDHGLRGREAQDDARFVEEATRRLGVPVTLERWDVESHRAIRRLSVEEAAREVRYTFLSRVAAGLGADAVALGHTADDQVETVLMHLIRGSGMAGLVGMSPLSHWPSHTNRQRTTLARPLLQVTREETEAYCSWRSITPRQDSSNRSLLFTRNRIRTDLLPLLGSYNPRFPEALLRLGRSLAQDQAHLTAETERAREALAASTPDGVVIERQGFAGLHPALQSRLLRMAYEELNGSALGLEGAHLTGMVRLSRGPAGRQMDLPGGLVFSVGYGSLELERRGALPPSQPLLLGEYPLAVPGKTRIPGWTVEARRLKVRRRLPATDSHVARLDGARMGRNLHVRGRRPGDRLRPLGMEGSRSLQDLFVDAKVPRAERDLVPLVVSDEGIAWVVGHRVAHWARLREDTAVVLELKFKPLEDAAT